MRAGWSPHDRSDHIVENTGIVSQGFVMVKRQRLIACKHVRLLVVWGTDKPYATQSAQLHDKSTANRTQQNLRNTNTLTQFEEDFGSGLCAGLPGTDFALEVHECLGCVLDLEFAPDSDNTN